MLQQFSGNLISEKSLVVRAKPFACFVLVLGTFSTSSLFDPVAALVVNSNEEFRIPLTFTGLPTPKQFKKSTSSLSDEQQRFVNAYRNMQLSKSVFGICVIHVQPQLEKILRLPSGSLQQEMKLATDLISAMLEHSATPAHLCYDGDIDKKEREIIQEVQQNLIQYRAAITDLEQMNIEVEWMKAASNNCDILHVAIYKEGKLTTELGRSPYGLEDFVLTMLLESISRGCMVLPSSEYYCVSLRKESVLIVLTSPISVVYPILHECIDDFMTFVLNGCNSSSLLLYLCKKKQEVCTNPNFNLRYVKKEPILDLSENTRIKTNTSELTTTTEDAEFAILAAEFGSGPPPSQSSLAARSLAARQMHHYVRPQEISTYVSPQTSISNERNPSTASSSVMRRLFGSTSSYIPAMEARDRLHTAIHSIDMRQSYLQEKIKKEHIAVKKYLQQKDKRSALMCLKRAKIYESQADQLMNQSFNLEQTMFTIESATTSASTMNCLREGDHALRQISHIMRMDDVEDTLDEIREQMEVASEISEAISQPLGGLFDEDELENELDYLLVPSKLL